MNAIAPWVIALAALAVLLGLAWAWWAHRQRLAEMQRRLAWNEQSRFELERHTQALDERLATMAQALKTLESARQPAPALPPAWPDTEPLGTPQAVARPACPLPQARTHGLAAAQALPAQALPGLRPGAQGDVNPGIQPVTQPSIQPSAQAFAETMPADLEALCEAPATPSAAPSAPPAHARVLPFRR